MKTITINKGKAHIVVECVKRGEYRIIDNSLTKADGHDNFDATALAFSAWDASVENLENPDSDLAALCDYSSQLKWQNVIMTTETIKAASLWEATRALQHVEITAYCPGDM